MLRSLIQKDQNRSRRSTTYQQ